MLHIVQVEKLIFACFVELFLKIQIKVKPCPTETGVTSTFPMIALECCCLVPIIITHELHFLVIKFKLIHKHPHTNVQYTLFHSCIDQTD